MNDKNISRAVGALLCIGILTIPVLQYGFIKPSLSHNHIETIVNDYRKTQGLHPLLHSGYLEKLAERRCGEIQQPGKYDHSGFHILAEENKGKFRGMGENLAHGFSNDNEVLNAWIASPLHKANLVGHWQFTAIAECGEYKVELFGNLK